MSRSLELGSRCAIALSVLCITATAPVRAQEPVGAERVTISGRVLDQLTRAPLPGVMVEFAELGVGVETDANGVFEVQGIKVGVYHMSLSRFGYRSSAGEFQVMRAGSFVTTLLPFDAVEVPAGRFVGRVVDDSTGEPIPDVDVQVREVFMGALTDEDGRFRLDAIPPGRYLAEFSHLGYANRQEMVEVVSGQTSDARLGLAVDPVEVDPIEVIVERRELILEDVGFYQRREDSFGEFIDLEFIERRAPREMTDLFTSFPGVTLVPNPNNPLERSVVLRGGRLGRGGLTGGSDDCYPSVVLDGLVAHRGGSSPAMIDYLVQTSAVAGVEIYPSSIGVPVEYSGVDSACGVIVIWTRR
jgi:hypothetical protein